MTKYLLGAFLVFLLSWAVSVIFKIGEVLQPYLMWTAAGLLIASIVAGTFFKSMDELRKERPELF